MPRTRRARAESAYERRIQSYLERHPGATRQEARGHREPEESRRRVERARARGGSEREARGHGGRADFLRYIREGDLVQLGMLIGDVERDARGRWRLIEKLVIPMSERRRPRRFRIRGLTDDELEQMIQDEEARGADLTLAPSLDQRRLL